MVYNYDDCIRVFPPRYTVSTITLESGHQDHLYTLNNYKPDYNLHISASGSHFQLLRWNIQEIQNKTYTFR